MLLAYPNLSIGYANSAAARILDTSKSLEENGLSILFDHILNAGEARTFSKDEPENHCRIGDKQYRFEFLEDETVTRVFLQIEHVDMATDRRPLYDSLPIMIYQKTSFDSFYNKEYLRFTGQKPEAANYRLAIHPDDRLHFEAAVQSATVNADLLQGDSPPTITSHSHRLRASNGEYRHVKITLMVEARLSTCLILDAHDVVLSGNMLKDKEQALVFAKAENQRLLDGENSAREGNRLKGEFLANTSHEIRTPIAGVIGMVDLLLDTDLDLEQKDYAESIRSSADALLTVINDVLDFSKIEAGKMQVDNRPFELTQMIKDIETMLSFMTSQKRLGLSIKSPPGPLYLVGDRGRVRQILTNLLSNAIKFTQKGAVGLALTTEEETSEYINIRFAVTDTGSGMTQETLDNLFRPFAQGDAGRTYGGTGLGLSICKKLVQLMDGDIGTNTELGKGSTFWFWLRFPKSSDDAILSQSASSKPSNSRTSFSHNSSISMSPMLAAESGDYFQEIPSTAQQAITARQQALDEAREDDVMHETPSASKVALAVAQPQAAETQTESIKRAQYSRSVSTDSVMTIRDIDERCESDGEAEDVNSSISIDVSESNAVLIPEHNGMSFGSRTDSAESQNGSVKSATSSVAGFEMTSSSDFGGYRRDSLNSSSTATAYKDKRILLAEDNDINCRIATSMLRKLGYACTVVKNGQEAVDAVDEQSTFDLILMDVQMPIMNGYEATQLIRQSPNTNMRSVPVIALTASAVSGDREKCMSAGMDDYLTKPVNSKQMEKKLKRWLFPE